MLATLWSSSSPRLKWLRRPVAPHPALTTEEAWNNQDPGPDLHVFTAASTIYLLKKWAMLFHNGTLNINTANTIAIFTAMRLPQNKLQQIKAIIHGVQTLLVFIAGCLTLAVMAKSDGHGGETKYYFALCFFTLPAVAFQVVVPLWSRAWRFCNVYAFATIDLLFCILWFVAAIAVAVWNASEVTTTEKPKKEATPKRDDTKETNPTKVLACGSETICKVSKATVGFAVVLFFLFAAASYLSICALIEYRKTGVKPHSTSNIQQSYSQRKNQLEKDAVWSSNTDDIRTSSDGPVNDDDGEHGKGLLRKSDDDGGYLPYPGRRTSYHSQMSVPPLYDPGVARN